MLVSSLHTYTHVLLLPVKHKIRLQLPRIMYTFTIADYLRCVPIRYLFAIVAYRVLTFF